MGDRQLGPHGEIPIEVDALAGQRLVKAKLAHTRNRCPACDKRIYIGQLVVLSHRFRVTRHAACVAKEARLTTDVEHLPVREHGLRVAVTGGRDFQNYILVAHCLGQLEIAVLAEGGASGADTLAARWARHTQTPLRVFLADWGRYGPRAGPIRNRLMLDHFQPDLLVAFSGGTGTTDCVQCAIERGIPLWLTWLTKTSPVRTTSG